MLLVVNRSGVEASEYFLPVVLPTLVDELPSIKQGYAHP